MPEEGPGKKNTGKDNKGVALISYWGKKCGVCFHMLGSKKLTVRGQD